MRKRFKPHWKVAHPLYNRWIGIKARCYKPGATAYEHYGGRGIRVCDRWLNSFEDFVADMGLPPDSTYTLDRVDNDGNYEPSNVRWATRSQQMYNKRKKPHSSSKYHGVSLNKQTKRYEAYITVNGKHVGLGHYTDPKEAARIYDEQAMFYYGREAKLNFKY